MHNMKTVKVYGFTKNNQGFYMIVMEFCSGGSLNKYLAKHGKELDWERKLDIAMHVCEGLVSIHKNNLVHKDLHTGNILEKSLDYWVILDLGFCNPADTTSRDKAYGKIPYVAPEVFKSKMYTKESDIYSLGIILWEIFTNRSPFYDLPYEKCLVIVKICEGLRPVIDPEMPREYKELMCQCWDADPQKRPTAVDCYKAIKKIHWKEHI